jgi:hypothetical protein
MGALSDAWDRWKAAERAAVDAKNAAENPETRRKLERARSEAWAALASSVPIPGDPKDDQAMKEMETFPTSPPPFA